GSNKLRQVFTPSRDLTVDQVAVFTSGTGTVRVTLQQGNSTIGSWSAATSGENHNVIGIGSTQLRAGTTYHLEFSAESGSLNMLTFRDGSLGTGYAYAQGGSWGDGHAQISSGGGWSNLFFTYADVAGVVFRTR
ncbi:MAG: hypothetical protein ACR2QO_01745, partial [Acidimicrobiales bacterium]